MKKTLLILAAMILFLGGCRKFDEIEASKVEMNDVTIERGWDYIKMSGGYDYPVELETMTLYISEKEDMSGAKTYGCVIDGKTFSVEADDLKDGTKYHFQYEYDNGYVKEKGEKGNAVTIDKPIVVTKDAGGITLISAVLTGELTNNDAANEIEERGFCWATEPQPTIAGTHHNCGGDTGVGTSTFSHNISNLQDDATYYFRAYIKTNFGVIYGEEKSFKTNSITGTINGREWIDLGLPSGLKWATCNVGASSPEDYGDYFAWGETETKSEYTESNSLTYGLTISGLHSQGYIDVGGNLTPSHDAATANWGGSWRMPTEDEIKELIDECTWTWTTQGGVKGYKVTGPNGNHIFLPVAGYRSGSSLYYAGEYGYYWSSTPSEDNSNYAYYLYFYSSAQYVNWYSRGSGRSVRPVSE